MLRYVLLMALILTAVAAKKSQPGEKPSWAKKDIRFYSEADMERLLDQWEVNDIIIIVLKITLSIAYSLNYTLHYVIYEYLLNMSK